MARRFTTFLRAVVLAATALFVSVSPAVAAPEDDFRRGVEAVRAGDPERAIEHFEAARAAGLDTGALHFNLGVAYYRAGRIEAAETSFRRAVDSGTMVAPALYQLGRIARERGDLAAARAHFRRAAEIAQTGALRSRARAALAGIATTRPPDYVYLGAGGGYDSNLSLTPSDASGVSEESDLFLEGVLVARKPLDDSHYLRASIYLQEFLDEDDFDLASLRGGIGRVGLIDGIWRWDAWVDGRHREFGGRAFDNTLLAGGELKRRVAPGWILDLDARLELVRGANRFDFLDGAKYDLEAALDEWGRDGWRLQAGLASADRDDRETADDFFSFSWTEFRLAAEHGQRLDDLHRLELGADWSRREYDGAEVRNGTRLGTREDDLLGLEAALERRLDADWSARASFRIEDRDSNLAEFDYDRKVLRVTAERLF
ncbi:MAG: tetratricopeptide repeat protein [Halofilum sp. (in: g-proteobacteria)]|nr:tetratricopeptide repeat protein [Halofilum sp. (in: g-proteobacteria)]